MSKEMIFLFLSTLVIIVFLVDYLFFTKRELVQTILDNRKNILGVVTRYPIKNPGKYYLSSIETNEIENVYKFTSLFNKDKSSIVAELQKDMELLYETKEKKNLEEAIQE